MSVMKNGKPSARGGKVLVPAQKGTPIRPIRQITLDSGNDHWINRLLMVTPTRGLIRIEWHSAVRGMIVPPNHSMVSMVQHINAFYPTRFSVADAQNLAVREAIERDFEWLIFLEDDVLPPVDMLLRLDHYVRNGPPVVSGLYYTKANPSQPLIYRGRGTGPYLDFKMGEQVWCDGLPMGCCLIHMGLLRAMWEDAQPYQVAGSPHHTREVFVSPARAWVSPTGDVNVTTGTSDLEWCDRVVAGGYFKKSGWGQYARKRYPFLVDTAIKCGHIAPDGTMYAPPATSTQSDIRGARGEKIKT